MEPIKVIRAEKDKDGHRRFILSRMPKFIYKRMQVSDLGDCLVAEDCGIYDAYAYMMPCGKHRAFAGREFDIPLEGGEIVKASGQWWACLPPYSEDDPPVSVGVSTTEDYKRDKLYIGVTVKRSTLRMWLQELLVF